MSMTDLEKIKNKKVLIEYYDRDVKRIQQAIGYYMYCGAD